MDAKVLINNPDKILVKKPFTRGIVPSLNLNFTSNGNIDAPARLPARRQIVISQDTFLEELDTYSHAIHSEFVLANKRIKVQYKDANGEVKERDEVIPVTRIALPLQRVIASKQKVHLTGKPMKFTLSNTNQTDEDKESFVSFCQSWISKNMNIGIAECIESRLTTGDCAMVSFFDDKKRFNWRTYSWKDGYCLLPHYDKYGNLALFGVYYSTTEDDVTTEKLDVWDDNVFYQYKKQNDEWAMVVNAKKHGFNSIPVAYSRGNVAWNDVQPLIESCEFHSSLWAESERYYTDPILFLKGDTDILPMRDSSGKAIAGLDETSDAKLLQANESKNIVNLTDFLLREIFRGSFTVSFNVGEISVSGDMPSVTVKLLFTAAIEKAIEQAKEIDPFIDKLVELFIFGMGIELTKSAQFSRLLIHGEIEPYIPQNTTEEVNMINQSKSMGTMSTETAAARNPLNASDEHARLKREKEEEASALQAKADAVIVLGEKKEPNVEKKEVQTAETEK